MLARFPLESLRHCRQSSDSSWKMVQTYLSGLVFVGGQFSASMFDEREVFDGNIDSDQLKVGPMGQFSYSSGAAQFRIMPDRIDLTCHNASIMPNFLIDAGRTVIDKLQSISQKISIPVSGFGMNCDIVLDRRSSGIGGSEFCRNLINPSIEDLIGISPVEVLEHVRFIKNEIYYTVRMEPEGASNGQNLFLAINGHQPVTSPEDLHTKIDKIEDFGTYVSEFHQRISDSVKMK